MNRHSLSEPPPPPPPQAGAPTEVPPLSRFSDSSLSPQPFSSEEVKDVEVKKKKDDEYDDSNQQSHRTEPPGTFVHNEDDMVASEKCNMLEQLVAPTQPQEEIRRPQPRSTTPHPRDMRCSKRARNHLRSENDASYHHNDACTTTQSNRAGPATGDLAQTEQAVEHVEEEPRWHPLSRAELATGLDDFMWAEPNNSVRLMHETPHSRHSRQHRTQGTGDQGDSPSPRQHHVVLSDPGAVSVTFGHGAAGDDVRSARSNIVEQRARMLPPIEPYAAYAVSSVSEEKDSDSQRGDGNPTDIRALRNELQQIEEAVDDMHGTLGHIVQAVVADDITATLSQQLDGEQQDRKNFVVVVVVGVLCCAGFLVVLLVINLDAGSPTTDENTCFADRDELLEAIDSFLRGPNLTLAERYGWPMNAWCVGKVQDFSSLLDLERNSLVAQFNEDISSWDMSNAIYMEAMFRGAAAFDADLTAWKVSKVTNMRYLFDDAISFNGDISTWDVSNVLNMRGMFRNTRFTGDLSAWNVSRVKSFAYTFDGSAFNESIPSWDVSGITDMSFMFQGARAFNQDLSSWKVLRVTSMQNMFNGAISFSGDISTWDVSSVVNMEGMFHESAFVGDISGWNVSKVRSFEETFSHSDFDGNISGWNVSSATTMASMFQNNTIFNQDLSNWDVSKVSDAANMFRYAEMFNGDVSTWDVSKLINARMMFEYAAAFEGGNLSGWDISQVIDTRGMFAGAESFNGNISKWNASRVKDMQWMFQYATKFNQDLSSWDVSRVGSFHEQFMKASSFHQDLCEWGSHIDDDVDDVAVERMFMGTACDSEEDPDLEAVNRGPFCSVCGAS